MCDIERSGNSSVKVLTSASLTSDFGCLIKNGNLCSIPGFNSLKLSDAIIPPNNGYSLSELYVFIPNSVPIDATLAMGTDTNDKTARFLTNFENLPSPFACNFSNMSIHDNVTKVSPNDVPFLALVCFKNGSLVAFDSVCTLADFCRSTASVSKSCFSNFPLVIKCSRCLWTNDMEFMVFLSLGLYVPSIIPFTIVAFLAA